MYEKVPYPISAVKAPHICKMISCLNHRGLNSDYCIACQKILNSSSTIFERLPEPEKATETIQESMSQRYPKYYKSVEGYKEIDVYAVHSLFEVNDPSGCIQHASKKLLLSGARTGGKSARKDIEEARDTLTRWLQLHP